MPEIGPGVHPLLLLVFMGIVTAIVGAWIWLALRVAFQQPVLPAYTPRVVPWGAGSVLVAVLVWYGTAKLAGLGYYMTNPGRVVRAQTEGGKLPASDLMILSALSNGATLLLVPMTLAITAGARRRDYGLAEPGLDRQVGQGVMAYPLLAPLVYGVLILAILVWGRESHPLETAIRHDRSPGMGFIMFLAGVVLAPAAEELIFRGVFLGWLTRMALGAGGIGRPSTRHPEAEMFEESAGTELVVDQADADVDFNPFSAPKTSVIPRPEPGRIALLAMANVVVSIVFAALHYQVWPTPIPIFFLSMGLGLLYQRTGGLAAPIALHMTFNGVSTLIMFLSGGAVGTEEPTVPNPVPAPRVRRGPRGAGVQRNSPDRVVDPVDELPAFCYILRPDRASHRREIRLNMLLSRLGLSDTRWTQTGDPRFEPTATVEASRGHPDN